MVGTVFIDKAKKTLRDHGHKLTGPRLAILDFMQEKDKHYSMQEIRSGLQKKFSGIGTATVYRNIDLFLKLGILRPSPIRNNQLRYTVNRTGDRHHQMICLKCGSRVEFNSCSFAFIEDEIEKKTHFEIFAHTLEVYGLCPGCLAGREDIGGERAAD